MKLFNIHAEGGSEITELIGLIGDGVDFSKWEPVIPLGIRDVVSIIGNEPVSALAETYENNDCEPDSEVAAALRLLRQAVALFTWLKIIPTLDAQHDAAGRQRRLGENEKGLTALQEFKDEQNILRLAYESVDALIEILDTEKFGFWIKSKKYLMRQGLLIRSKEEFDDYFNIGSHRLFVTLLPIIREVQGAHVAPVLGQKFLQMLLSDSEQGEAETLREPAARALALLTMQKAIERLPVEVIPEGIVQVQQSQPVNSRLKAEQSARAAVAASLVADARKYLIVLQNLVAELNAETTAGDDYVGGPIIHSKGMTF